MRKQFDLQYYLEHQDVKVVTRDNRNVRIICTDCKDPTYPIIALIDSNVVEYIANRMVNGCKFADCRENNEDLFFDLPDPAKKKVPLNYDDLQERIKAGKTMWIVNETTDISKGYTRCISNFDCNGVYYVFEFEIMFLSYQKLIEHQIHFADGTPCWKEEEE